MVGTFKTMACARMSHRSKHQYFLVENAGGKRVSPAAALHGVPLQESFEAVGHPAEPSEDNPVRCPPRENNILLDGMMWRERVARSLRSQTETHSKPEIERLGTWHEGDALDRSEFISNNPGRPDHSNAREKKLFVTHSAPEFAVARLLGEAS